MVAGSGTGEAEQAWFHNNVVRHKSMYYYLLDSDLL